MDTIELSATNTRPVADGFNPVREMHARISLAMNGTSSEQPRLNPTALVTIPTTVTGALLLAPALIAVGVAGRIRGRPKDGSTYATLRSVTMGLREVVPALLLA